MNVGVLEAKNRLSELIEAAQRGEEVVITKRGEPAVTLSPVGNETARKARAREALAQAKRISEEITAQNSGRQVTRADVREAIVEGRR